MRTTNTTSASHNTPNFTAKIRLCDKGLLDLNHNQKLLTQQSPMDFFYDVSSTKTNLDLFIRKLKSTIRKYQNNENNSEFKKKLLKKSFIVVNDLSTLINKCAILKNIPEVYKSNKLLKKTSPEKANYIDTWAIFGNSTPNKTININIEDKRIEDIANLKDSTIFIMNHDNVVRDRFIYPILNSFLNYAYATLNRQADCPRPYIVVSKNVVKNAGNKTMQNIFRKVGLVSVDAHLTERKHSENIKPVKAMIENFIDDKANIFIFPEGNNSIFKDKSLKEKFQLGFIKILKMISEKKESINIIPIGITYPADKKSMGNIFIGEVLKLNREEKIWSLTTPSGTEPIGKVTDKDTLKHLSDTLANQLEKCVTASKALEID
ncbi:1-acyl-sn-glycerol-3-phosphate acyltransferase [bacterium]|nr:1-acyl-sn-glycerol-3-phosphate acyltransferase [bacterium]